jgi:hypothetical protein
MSNWYKLTYFYILNCTRCYYIQNIINNNVKSENSKWYSWNDPQFFSLVLFGKVLGELAPMLAPW